LSGITVSAPKLIGGELGLLAATAGAAAG